MLTNGQPVILDRAFDAVNFASGAVAAQVPEADVSYVRSALEPAERSFRACSAKATAEPKAPILWYAGSFNEGGEYLTGLLITKRCFAQESVCAEPIPCADERAADGRLGLLLSDEACQSASGLVQSAVSDGAEIVRGGKVVEGARFCFEPTMLTNVHQAMGIAHAETLEPMVVALPYSEDGGEFPMIDSAMCGSAAYVFTADLSTAFRAAHDFRAGSVCVDERDDCTRYLTEASNKAASAKTVHATVSSSTRRSRAYPD